MGRAPRTQRVSGGRRRGRGLLRGVWVVGVYLCWGVGLTWAVAWGVAWAAAPEFEVTDTLLVENEQQPSWVVSMCSRFGWTGIFVDENEERVFSSIGEPWTSKRSELPWFADHAVPIFSDVLMAGPYFVAAYGWPLRALAFELWAEAPPPDRYWGVFGFDDGHYGALVVPGGLLRGPAWYSDTDLYLPLLPLWRGLIANVLFYALLVWVLRRGFVLLRGRRRRRRGRCWVRGGCGYDLTGLDSATCPECGRPVGADAEQVGVDAGPVGESGREDRAGSSAG